jgi:hypothetical protein
MIHLPWSESFAIGHKVLDAEHRRLADLINEVADAVGSKASPEQIAGVLRVLRSVTVEHLRQENAILWELKSGTYEPLKGRTPRAASAEGYGGCGLRRAYDRAHDAHGELRNDRQRSRRDGLRDAESLVLGSRHQA